MQFSEAVTSVTRNYIIPRSYDTVSKGSPVLMTLLRKAEKWRTGLNLEVIIKYQDSTNGGNAGIASRLDTTRDNTRTKMTFAPKMAYKPVVIADVEQVLNQGDERVIDLLDAEFDSQAQSLTTLMATNLYTGSGAGDNWDSLANAADDSTNFATYGGLSRSTYTTIRGYYLASAGAITLAKLATAMDATTVGMDSPDIIATSKAIWSTYESLLTPSIRMNYATSGYPRMDEYGFVSKQDAMAGAMGFDSLFYRGAAVIRDEQIPSGKVFFINSDAFKFYGIDMNLPEYKKVNFRGSNKGVPAGVPGRVPTTFGFSFRQMMEPVDQETKVGYLQYNGNFVATNPRLLGQLTGAS